MINKPSNNQIDSVNPAQAYEEGKEKKGEEALGENKSISQDRD